MRPILAVIFLSAFVFGAEQAAAVCSGPTGADGQMQWISPSFSYCDGTNWNSMASSATATSCTTVDPGTLTYRSSEMQYCNGSVWVGTNTTTLVGRCSAAGEIAYDTTLVRPKWCDGSNYRTVGGTTGTATLTYVSSALTNTNGASLTFSSQALGTASATRYVIVGVASRSASALSVTGVTVAGTTGTLISSFSDSNSTAAFYAVHVPVVSTGDVVVSFSASALRAGVTIWSATNLQSLTPYSTASIITSGAASAPVNVQANGFILATGYDTYANDSTWGNLTENVDRTSSDSALAWHFSSASDFYASAQTNITISNSLGGTWADVSYHVISLR